MHTHYSQNCTIFLSEDLHSVSSYRTHPDLMASQFLQVLRIFKQKAPSKIQPIPSLNSAHSRLPKHQELCWGSGHLGEQNKDPCSRGAYLLGETDRRQTVNTGGSEIQGESCVDTQAAEVWAGQGGGSAGAGCGYN